MKKVPFFNRAVVYVLRLPLMMIQRMGDALYPLLRGKAAKEVAEKREREFGEFIRRRFEFLFRNADTVILPREPSMQFPPPFDYVTALVERNGIQYRLFQGMDEQVISLRPSRHKGRWHELSLVLELLDSPPGITRGSIHTFDEGARLLTEAVETIERAFSPRYCDGLMDKLDEVYARDRIIIKQLETEINRRLYDQ